MGKPDLENRRPVPEPFHRNSSRYRRVAVGGTFDIIHLGHEILLGTAFKIGENVVIGLSTDKLAEEIGKGHRVHPFHKRKDALLNFLEEKGYLDKAEIVPIDDRYGTTLEDVGLEAVVVSRETAGIADQINQIRVRKGLKPLNIIAIETVKAEDGKPISSSRIRRGEIDKFGKPLWRVKPPHHRGE
ncbi:MAG: phosphopantetheine adenylyltransferase [Candidatus Bathyarchaeia archaeon]